MSIIREFKRTCKQSGSSTEPIPAMAMLLTRSPYVGSETPMVLFKSLRRALEGPSAGSTALRTASA